MPRESDSRSTAAPRRRRHRSLRLAAAFAVLIGLVAYVVAQYVTGGTGPARCTVRAAGEGTEDYEIAPEQAANAATITAVASQRGLPERAVTIALATAMQESGLRNLGGGDRDSLGLFQQRPSQGWGTEREILDPAYAAGEFYDHLVSIPGYSRLPLTVAAQRVQHSGFPQAYAKHEANASLLTAALTGRRAASFSCTANPGGGDGKAGSATRVRERLVRDFGADVLPAQARTASASQGAGGGGRSAHVPKGGPENGRSAALTVPAPTRQRGWELAHWAVAHAEDLHIARVSYGNRVWDAARSEAGWRPRDEGDARPGAGEGPAPVTIRPAKGG